MSFDQSVNGITATSRDEYEAFLRDEKRIEKIRQRIDFNDKKQVERLYSSICTGSIRFESKVGFAFEDEVDRLLKSGPMKATSKKAIQREVAKDEIYADKELVEHYLKKERVKRVVVKYVLIGVSIIALFACIFFVISRISSDANNENGIAEIAKAKKDNAFVFTTISPEVKDTVTYDEYTIPDILPQYADAYGMNPDLIGWIKIDDTNIDYPVVKGEDNSFYLSHGFNGKKDANGCIFADMNCDIYPRSMNVILYGHHMKSGKMFANLEKYNDYAYYEKHKTFAFDTIYETAKYEIVFVFRDYVHNSDDTDFKYYEFVNVNSETEFNSYMDELKNKSLYETGVEASYDDQLLTLSTCDYQQTNGRFVIIARKIH